MSNLDELYGSIKLDGESVFFHHLSQDKEKLELYKKALIEGKISFFDQTILTRLRKMYFGFYSAIIYMFYDPTTFNNIGNRVELLVHAIPDKDYKIVHGMTDSVREIKFFMYGVEHLDSNSWVEVREGNRTVVYDLFSLMKFDKDVYYSLEHPDVFSEYSKDIIMNNDNYDKNQFMSYTDGFSFTLVYAIPRMEKGLMMHPFRSILEPEFSRFKKDVSFDDIVLEHKVFQKEKFD